MRQKKVSRNRTEVRVEAFLIEDCNGKRYEIQVHDTAGMVAKTFCVARSNVASKATQVAAMALSVPEGRIKINRVEYS